MNIFQRIWNSIKVSDNDEFLKAIAKRDEEIKALTLLCEGKELSKDELKKEIDSLMKENGELFIKIPKELDIDIFCKATYKEIPNIVYKNKMKFNGVYYSVYLNELIIEKAYEVLKLKSQVQKMNDRYAQFKRYGDKIAEITTWTDDKNLDKSGDLYLYPSQIVALKKGDCEDITALTASMDLEIGMCWGFYYPETFKTNPKNSFGHAFNCFVLEGKLYILECTGDESVIEEYTGQDHYTINYIITKNNTYVVDGSVQFGELAGWTTQSRTNYKPSKVASNIKKRTTKKLLSNKLKR